MLKDKILDLIDNVDDNVEQRLNHFLECINGEKSIDNVLEWLQNIKDNLPATVTEINLNEVNDGWDLNSETGTLEYTFLSSGTSGTVGAIIKTAGSDLTIDNFSLKKTARVRGICQGKKGEILAALSDSNLYDMYSSATRKDNWYWVSKRLSMHHKTQNKRWYEVVIAYTGDGSGDDPGVEVYWDYDTNRTAISAGENEANLIRKQLGNDVSAVNHRLIQLKITAGDATTEVDSVGFTFRRFETLVDQGSA